MVKKECFALMITMRAQKWKPNNKLHDLEFRIIRVIGLFKLLLF